MEEMKSSCGSCVVLAPSNASRDKLRSGDTISKSIILPCPAHKNSMHYTFMVVFWSFFFGH